MNFQRKFIKDIRNHHFDMAIDFSRGDRGALISLISGAQKRIGYDPPGKRKRWRRRLFTDLISSDNSRHVIDNHLDCLRLLDIEPDTRQMSFHWSRDDEETITAILKKRGIGLHTPLFIIHPTSRWMFKAWTSEGYAAVADYVQRNEGMTVIITSGPEHKELVKVHEIMGYCTEEVIDLSGQLTLRQLGSLIQRSAFFFGIDSAPMHMAVALGTPVMALFGPSGEHMWGPLGEEHSVITATMACRPCGRDGCNGSKRSLCLEAIRHEDLCPLVARRLSEIKRGDGSHKDTRGPLTCFRHYTIHV